MDKDDVRAAVAEELNSRSSPFKQRLSNMFYGAVGALLAFLLVGEWQDMRTTANDARQVVAECKVDVVKIDQKFTSQITSLTREVATVKASTTVEGPIAPTGAVTLDAFQESENEIQQILDKDAYRAKQ